MIKYCNINGTIVKMDRASIPINDVGLLRGYGMFDYFIFEKQFPFFFDDYLDRFYNSAKAMDLVVPMERSVLKRQILELIHLNQEEEGGLRLLLTAGTSIDGSGMGRPNLALVQYKRPRYPEECFTVGSKVISTNYQRFMAEVKTTNYFVALKMAKEIEAAGAVDVLYHHEGWIRESARANAFFLTKKGTIVTPNEGVLKGITRKNLITALEGKIEVEERPIHMDELASFEEAYLTSSIRSVMPIIQIDDIKIGTGTIGPIFKKVESYLTTLRKKRHDEDRGATI
ncbi:MAG: aminotransferase class IV [Saprospiraceae bacterium]|nr:aminotransferase class IV [Saprospiraceae bacterium]